VVVEVAAAADGSAKREVVVRPVDTSTERSLLYRKWVNERREYVARVSNGKLGYVHIRDMGTGSLNQLYVDLDPENRAKKGVVVDIRNNNGGFVNAYALDVFARRPYMTMTPREMPPSPARTMLGQRALELPTILVTNQMSLSDAEDFTEGYRALSSARVVGEPTAGWIIYTGGTQLIDGSTLRSPFIRITGADGKVMERNRAGGRASRSPNGRSRRRQGLAARRSGERAAGLVAVGWRAFAFGFGRAVSGNPRRPRRGRDPGEPVLPRPAADQRDRPRHADLPATRAPSPPVRPAGCRRLGRAAPGIRDRLIRCFPERRGGAGR